MCHPLKWINKISRENEICITLLLLVFLFECNSYFSFASWKLREFLFISEIEFQLASKKFMAMRYALPAEGQILVNQIQEIVLEHF